MTATIIFLLLDIALVGGYIWYTVKKFGVPTSLSKTYYLLQENKKGWMFQAALIGGGLLLLPVWMNLSPDWWMCLGFLACACIMLVGGAARYLRMEEKGMHTVCAWIAGAASVCWSIFAYKYLWIVPLVFAIAGIVMYFVDKKNHTFWVQMAVFASAYVSLIIALFLV